MSHELEETKGGLKPGGEKKRATRREMLSRIPEPFRTAVFLDGASGLRVGELLGLKWEDVDFGQKVIHIRRSIVSQKIGPPKTEASQKPIPMNSELVKALRLWKMKTIYNHPNDWVYASPAKKGTQPYWPKSIYRVYIKRAADKIGLQKRIAGTPSVIRLGRS